MVDFSSILANSKLGEIEKPKPLPVGSWATMIKGVDLRKLKKQDGTTTDILTVNVETTAPLGDVDPGDIESAGGIAKVSGKKLKIDFFLTPDAMYRLQDFILDHVKLDLRGISLDQAIGQLVNNQVGIKVKHRQDERNPDMIYADVERTFAI